VERIKRLAKLMIKLLSNLAVPGVSTAADEVAEIKRLGTAMANYCGWHRLAAK
jgi:hypothetical protein